MENNNKESFQLLAGLSHSDSASEIQEFALPQRKQRRVKRYVCMLLCIYMCDVMINTISTQLRYNYSRAGGQMKSTGSSYLIHILHPHTYIYSYLLLVCICTVDILYLKIYKINEKINAVSLT